MRTYLDAKTMAKSLRAALASQEITLTHSECLEIVAQQFGFTDWNVLAARIAADPERAGIRTEPGIPVLRIFDEDKAREFYVDFLGFTVDWEHRFGADMPLYLQVSRTGTTLHLSEHHGDASPGSTVYIPMSGIADFHSELTGKRYRYARPGIEETPWGTRMITIADPFGNHLRFNESD